MAGAGFKTFGVGDVLTASDVNTYLMQQAVMNFADSGARGSAIGSAVLAEGMVSYLQDTNAVEVYDGSSWTGVGQDAGIGSNVVDGSFTSLFSTTSSTLTDVATLSITPSTNTSRVLIIASGIMRNSAVPSYSVLALTDNSNNVLYQGNAASSRGQGTWGLTIENAANANLHGIGAFSFMFLHSPATTSATTYKLRAKVDTGTLYFGTSTYNDGDAAATTRVPTTFYAIEVAA